MFPVQRMLPGFVRAGLMLCLVAQACAAIEPWKFDFNRYLQGQYVYERNCVVCHGATGDGGGELAASLQPRPRSFREGMFKFRTTPFGQLPTDDDLRRTIQHGLSGTSMGMFAQLSPEDLTAVIDYVKSFSRRWRKEENYAEPIKLPALPAWFSDAEQRAAHAVNGKQLFQNTCAVCHGAEADGQGLAGATLKDLWNQPAPPSDLRRPHLRCGDGPEDIYRVLATGLNGTPMVAFEGVLGAEQRWDIIAWIFSQKLP